MNSNRDTTAAANCKTNNNITSTTTNPVILVSQCCCGQCRLHIHHSTGTSDGRRDDNSNYCHSRGDVYTKTNTSATNTYASSSIHNAEITTATSRGTAEATTTTVIDCHCSKCRTYHGGAFTSYWRISPYPATLQPSSFTTAVTKVEQINAPSSSSSATAASKQDESSWKDYIDSCDEMAQYHHPNKAITSPSTTTATMATTTTTSVTTTAVTNGIPSMLVKRIFCAQCYCKLATTCSSTSSSNDSNSNSSNDSNNSTFVWWYINLGCIVDSTIPIELKNKWRTHRIPTQLEQRAQWYPAQPRYNNNKNKLQSQTQQQQQQHVHKTHQNTSRTAPVPQQFSCRGGCSCGRVRYAITSTSTAAHSTGSTSNCHPKNKNRHDAPWYSGDDDNNTPLDVPNELPHCYCLLCRQMSGTAFVSWLYISIDNFTWMMDVPEPTIIRTTDFGQRHVCTYCGVVLTIQYDDQMEDYIWPTAASIYDYTTCSSNNNSDIMNDKNESNDTSNQNNDASFLPNIDTILQSVSHIYCQDNAAWYEIPNDGLLRYYDE
jgi:hypothetical protein